GSSGRAVDVKLRRAREAWPAMPLFRACRHFSKKSGDAGPRPYAMGASPALGAETGRSRRSLGVNLGLGIFDGALSAGTPESNSPASTALRGLLDRRSRCKAGSWR